MVLIFHVDDCLIISPSKDKINDVYASLQEYFKVEDDGQLKMNVGIELDHRPDGSIHLRQNYLTEIILNIIPGTDKSSAKPIPAVKPPISKNERYQAIQKNFN